VEARLFRRGSAAVSLESEADDHFTRVARTG